MSVTIPQPTGKMVHDINYRQIYYDLERLTPQKIDISTGVGADTEFTVAHGLSRIPQYLVICPRQSQTDAYIQVKPSGTAWTVNNIYLKCNTATATFSILLW